MIKTIYAIGCLLLGFLVWAPVPGFTQAPQEDARVLYNKALEHSLHEEWNEAIRVFQQLIETSPESEYLDDAYFWVGHCLENISEHPAEAYQAYQTFVDSFPGSAWIDEAVVRQIHLAAQLVRDGEAEYKTLLQEQIGNEHAPVRQQAALALGRLGDKQSVSVLRQMISHQEHGPEARELLSELMPGEENFETETSGAHLQVQESDTDTSRIQPARFPLFGAFTTEHRAYKTMLKTEDRWSQQELLDFAMWYVLKPGQFKDYFNQDAPERKAYLIKEWGEADPVPETSRNEALQEFERRVQFAREHFAGFWNFKHAKYLPEQYQREGWPNAPWDARGEIYIKYGEPDFTTVGNELNEVHWTYYRHNVDFVIRKYMTNIYGNAISLGELGWNMYQYDLANMAYRFIEEKRFLYP